jgi:hypothetical protein
MPRYDISATYRTLEKAVRWCAAAQCALLDVQWPAALLMLPDCAPEMDSVASKLIFRGLRIRMGASFGGGLIRKPLNTGMQLKLPPLHGCKPELITACLRPRFHQMGGSTAYPAKNPSYKETCELFHVATHRCAGQPALAMYTVWSACDAPWQLPIRSLCQAAFCVW